MEKIRRPTERQTVFMDYMMLKDNLSSRKKLDIRCAILPGCYVINALAVCKYSGTVLRLKHLWKCHCLMETGYTRTLVWPHGSWRRQVFCFQQWLVACAEGRGVRNKICAVPLLRSTLSVQQPSYNFQRWKTSCTFYFNSYWCI